MQYNTQDEVVVGFVCMFPFVWLKGILRLYCVMSHPSVETGSNQVVVVVPSLPSASRQQQQQQQQRLLSNPKTVPTASVMEAYKKFQHAKMQCLYGQKRDKSSVGQLDDGVIEICTLLLSRFCPYKHCILAC